MSKKDRQHQKHEPANGAEAVRHVHGQIAMMDDAQLSAAVVSTDGVAPSVDETPALRASLREFQELSAARAAEVLDLKRDLDIIAKAARHGAPPEGFEPKTAEGKEALEQVVLLGNIAATQRARADSEAKGRNELASDLMVVEQTAAGRAPNIALQTDLGKRAAHALSEVLTMLDKMNEAHLEGDALPANGWASTTARHLVEAVGPQPGLRASDARSLILGDLLAQLLPHTGETGQNETASDVLRRIVFERGVLIKAQEEASKIWKAQQDRLQEQDERMGKIQSAMVARRAPDAEAGGLLEDIYRLLVSSGPVESVKGAPDLIRGMLPKIVAEWRGLRGFFSEAPLTAVAIRDDGHNGPVRERYSLLVLTWDGNAVKTRYIEEARPWGDIRPYLEQTVRQNLIPGAYR